MADADWAPPAKVDELFAGAGGSMVSGMNAPTAGARKQEDLPDGGAPFQLYSLGTPNGTKVSIMLEELGIPYDAHTISIGAGMQFNSGFVGVNPNSKIPCAIDKEGPDGKPIHLWESAAIVLYLAEKHGKFMPSDPRLKAETMQWLFWQMGGQGPMTGQFGHYFVYAPVKEHGARNYGVARYGMEVQRLCDVLDKHLAGRTWMVGSEYSIADIVCFSWFNMLRTAYVHSSGVAAKDFLGWEKYTNAVAWADRILARPAVVKGLTVCSMSALKK